MKRVRLYALALLCSLTFLSMHCGQAVWKVAKRGQIEILPSPVIGHNDSLKFTIDLEVIKPKLMRNKSMMLDFYLEADGRTQKLTSVKIPAKSDKHDTLFKKQVRVELPFQIDFDIRAFIEVKSTLIKDRNGMFQQSALLGLAEVFRDSAAVVTHLSR